MAIRAESFYFDGETGGTLQTRIKRRVVSGILSGQFGPGERMPSSRALARHLGISRITVTIAYTDLVADDYLEARGRSGYFVSGAALASPNLAPSSPGEESAVDWSRLLGHRTPGPSPITRPPDWRSYPYPFIYGQTDPKLFDHQNWRLCALQALGQKDFDVLASDQYENDDPLLVEYIRRNILTRRGISARNENILITMGAQNAIWISAQLLLTQRRTAVIESPGYPGLREVLRQTRCHVHSVPVDGDGLSPDAIPQAVDVVFVTPSHHCPTNATMPTARRRALLEMAAERGFVVVEDDYEFELSFRNAPSPSLKSMDAGGSVIHIGSAYSSISSAMKMTTEEAFVKVLQTPRDRENPSRDASASSDRPSCRSRTCFPRPGSRFWDCAHECSGGMMADGYTRASGKMSMMIAQNGPGITNFVTAVKTAYWNHTPLLLVTPQAANKTIGQGGFQEVEQMKLFEGHGRLPGGGARPLPHRRGAEPRDPPRRAGPRRLRRSTCRGISGPRWSTSTCPRWWSSSAPAAATARREAAALLSNAEKPGDPERRGRGAGGRHPGLDGAGRAARCAGLRGLSAQRRLPRLASAFRGAAWATTARRRRWS
jgi:GntR family transcriptional regulator/MocR family aminotransferase